MCIRDRSDSCPLHGDIPVDGSLIFPAAELGAFHDDTVLAESQVQRQALAAVERGGTLLRRILQHLVQSGERVLYGLCLLYTSSCV